MRSKELLTSALLWNSNAAPISRKMYPKHSLNGSYESRPVCLWTCCRIVSAYRNKIEETEIRKWIQRFGDLTFPQFVQMIIDGNERYGKDNVTSVHNPHWRPFYLSHCGFCDVSFTGQGRVHLICLVKSLPPYSSPFLYDFLKGFQVVKSPKTLLIYDCV